MVGRQMRLGVGQRPDQGGGVGSAQGVVQPVQAGPRCRAAAISRGSQFSSSARSSRSRARALSTWSAVAPASPSIRSVHEAFVELVQHDDGLMRAEFDALIDACWHRPPPPPRARPQPVPRPPLWPGGPLV
ncbi:hypothetical protein [Plantactinospora alkalitolerans]|uniref:hypothetical protein n=1 Tax=Plantactinospora alkalitolerans TaxID=2789879 RepID=UPI0018ACA9EA|nr:hypothetical protein [Plantactinospora alkalitolerans]